MVPHVNDARRLAECARLLGGPKALERAASAGGRRVIDAVSPGQREFQALLLWVLLSPRRSLAWDGHHGRAFGDLESYYTWVSPQPGYLATGWTVAARVARYLLPVLGADCDARPACAGIPGLRLEGTATASIRLVHLPTGGILELRDRGRATAAEMARDLRREACHTPGDEEAYEAGGLTWQGTGMNPGEADSMAAWTLGPHAPVLSAVMARVHVLWQHWPTGAELDLSPAGIPRLSWWAGPGTGDIARLLVSSAIRAEGAEQIRGPGHSVTIRLNSSCLQLRGPIARVSA